MRIKSLTAAALIGATFTATIPAAPALAGPRGWNDARYERHYDRRHHRGDRHYRGQRCGGDSTAGLLVGGALGALLGRAVDTRGDRAPGTIIGAGAGALLGREVAKGC